MADTALDDAYANRPHIPGAEDYPPRWATAAAAFRTALGPRARLDIPYGSADRQRFDLFLPETAPRGLMVFVHGGFWRAFGRGDWSHLAAGGVSRGWAVALPGYTLAPTARIRDITAEVATALVAAADEVPAGPVVVTGHSAGGHLSARMLCADLTDRLGSVAERLVRTVPISPLADLRPMIGLSMNADWHMDPAEAAAESPMLHRPRPGASAHVWVGGDERPAFLDQARWLSEAWGAALTVEPGRHHFDVIDSLTEADGALTRAVLDGL